MVSGHCNHRRVDPLQVPKQDVVTYQEHLQDGHRHHHNRFNPYTQVVEKPVKGNSHQNTAQYVRKVIQSQPATDLTPQPTQSKIGNFPVNWH